MTSKEARERQTPIQRLDLKPGEWIGHYHCADIRGGVAVMVFDLDGQYDTEEIVQAGRAIRQRGGRKST